MNLSTLQSQAVRLDRISVRYRDVVAVDNVNLVLPAGEILALLGPSGCGKSTLLRSVAGFVSHAGDIHIGDKVMTRVPPHRRNIGMVFQDYALFPHMTVAENVGFGLKMRRVAGQEIAARVAEALALVGLEGLSSRMARQLSGGQQQRVALARSLVIRPAVLLLDEPLSALDKKLREEMRVELRRIQRLTGVTTIFVTHDQDEALGLADRLALMSKGSLLQIGKPEEIYRRPVSPFVAQFVGMSNIAAATCRAIDASGAMLELAGVGAIRSAVPAEGIAAGSKVRLFVRPERIGFVQSVKDDQSLAATITSKTYLGRYIEFGLRLKDGTTWVANLADDAALSRVETGATVSLAIEPRDVLTYAESASTT